jgi:hypothetical protein
MSWSTNGTCIDYSVESLYTFLIPDTFQPHSLYSIWMAKSTGNTVHFNFQVYILNYETIILLFLTWVKDRTSSPSKYLWRLLSCVMWCHIVQNFKLLILVFVTVHEVCLFFQSAFLQHFVEDTVELGYNIIEGAK